MTNILIVEDDPMVQFIHRNYLEKIGTFDTIYSSETIADAKKLLASRSIQLVLLDIRLKDGNGIDFLTDLRRTKQTVDVILITAANEVNIVNDALHLGVIDYLIKPFTLERFEKSIQRYRTKHQALVTDQLDQSQLDTYFEPQPTIAPTVDLGKGLSKATLQLIQGAIKQLPQPFTVAQLTTETGLSHVSVRKYLSFLEDHHFLKGDTIYRKTGRPYKTYQMVTAPHALS
ncbi:response regulator [Lacticaseibacillus paracasei]